MCKKWNFLFFPCKSVEAFWSKKRNEAIFWGVKLFVHTSPIVSCWKAQFCGNEFEVLNCPRKRCEPKIRNLFFQNTLWKFLFLNTWKAKGRTLNIVSPAKQVHPFFFQTLQKLSRLMHKQHKKSFFETDELDYRVAFRKDIMARQDFQKVCRSLCIFQT